MLTRHWRGIGKKKKMHLSQKSIFLKIIVDYNNLKLNYSNTSFFFKNEKECMIFNINIKEISFIKERNEKFLTGAIVFSILSCMVLIGMYINSNTIDNFLFWFIPCIVCWFLFLTTIRKIILIPTDFGTIKLLDQKNNEKLINLLKQLDYDYESYSSFYKKGESFDEKIYNFSLECETSNLDRSKKITFVGEKLNQCKCPICNKRKDVNIIKSHRIFSFFIFTNFQHKYIIGCKACLRNEIKKENVLSILLGIWSFPLGLLATPIVIVINIVKIYSLKPNILSYDFKKYLSKEMKA
ncbi:MAG: hypothetical protein IK024_03350 [Treponema sp.]|nr:hypothetical protein [Treponema sp.]